MIEKILADDFMDYREVYRIAKGYGMKKSDVKKEKAIYGVKTVQVQSKNGEDIWLWYIPERIWEKYHA